MDCVCDIEIWITVLNKLQTGRTLLAARSRGGPFISRRLIADQSPTNDSHARFETQWSAIGRQLVPDQSPTSQGTYCDQIGRTKVFQNVATYV